MKVSFLIGRIVFGGFFLYSGINHFLKRREMKPYVASKGVPMPDAAVLLSGAALIFGGASILLGVKPKYGGMALAGFLGAVSPLMHDFWNAPSEQQMNEMTQFLKNMALLGAAVALLAQDEPWPASIPVGQPGPMEKVAKFARRLAA